MARPPDPTAKISLLRAAEEVFAEQGIATAKVEEISRRAGLSKGAFYLHFASKDEAFKQVVESFLARLAAFVKSPLETESLPSSPEEVTRYWLECDAQVFDFMWQNRALVRIVGTCQGQYEYLFQAFADDLRTSSRAWLDHLKSQRMLRQEIDTDLVSTLLWGAYHELVMKMLSSPRKPPIDEWLTQALSTFLLGVATPQLADAVRRPTRAHHAPSTSRTRTRA